MVSGDNNGNAGCATSVDSSGQDHLNSQLRSAVISYCMRKSKYLEEIKNLLQAKADPTACVYSKEVPDNSRLVNRKEDAPKMSGKDIENGIFKAIKEAGVDVVEIDGQKHYSYGNVFHVVAFGGDKGIAELLLKSVPDQKVLDALKSKAYITAFSEDENYSEHAKKTGVCPTPQDIADFLKNKETTKLFNEFLGIKGESVTEEVEACEVIGADGSDANESEDSSWS